MTTKKRMRIAKLFLSLDWQTTIRPEISTLLSKPHGKFVPKLPSNRPK